MATKATWLFNGSSQSSGRAWGFSESWFTNLAGDALITAMDLVSTRRAQILSKNTQIVGYRIGQAGGRSFVVRKLFDPPSSNDASNMPVDAALCQMDVAGGTARKKFFFHDLPDDWVVRTTIDPARFAAINLVMQTISAAGFLVRFQLQAAISAPILEVSALGVVKTSAAIGLAQNNIVSFLAVRDINNRPIRGSYVVTNVADAQTFTVAHWPGNVVGRRGRVRLVSFDYGGALFLPNSGIIGGASRKVGRPFFQFRGRVPVKR